MLFQGKQIVGVLINIMKRITLSLFTLGLVLVSCNKDEIVTVSENQTIEENQAVGESQIDMEEEPYAYIKELSVLDVSGEIETKFLVSAESEAVYNEFINYHELTVEYVSESVPNTIISNEEESLNTESAERPNIEIRLLDNEHSLQEGVSVKIVLNSREVQDRDIVLLGNMSFVSYSNNVTVSNTSNNDFDAKYEFRIKWYTTKWRTHHWNQHPGNTTSNEFFGNYYESRITVYPHYPGIYSTMTLNFY